VKAVQDGTDGDRCLAVGRVEEVSVGAKSDRWVGVPQAPGDRADPDALGRERRGGEVARAVEGDLVHP